jgi:hypothetical protein
MISPPTGFRIVAHHGIWRVTLDGRFFGDFRTREHANDCIGESQRLTGGVRVTRDNDLWPPS